MERKENGQHKQVEHVFDLDQAQTRNVHCDWTQSPKVNNKEEKKQER